MRNIDNHAAALSKRLGVSMQQPAATGVDWSKQYQAGGFSKWIAGARTHQASAHWMSSSRGRRERWQLPTAAAHRLSSVDRTYLIAMAPSGIHSAPRFCWGISRVRPTWSWLTSTAMPGY